MEGSPFFASGANPIILEHVFAKINKLPFRIQEKLIYVQEYFRFDLSISCSQVILKSGAPIPSKHTGLEDKITEPPVPIMRFFEVRQWRVVARFEGLADQKDRVEQVFEQMIDPRWSDKNRPIIPGRVADPPIRVTVDESTVCHVIRPALLDINHKAHPIILRRGVNTSIDPIARIDGLLHLLVAVGHALIHDIL